MQNRTRSQLLLLRQLTPKFEVRYCNDVIPFSTVLEGLVQISAGIVADTMKKKMLTEEDAYCRCKVYSDTIKKSYRRQVYEIDNSYKIIIFPLKV